MTDIKEIIEKSFSFGVGLAAFSRDKIEELVEDMVRRGEVAQKDARQLAGDLVEKGEAQRKELREMIGEEVKKAYGKMNLASKSDVIDRDELRQLIREEV